MQIILTENEKKWSKLIGLTLAIYALIYYVNKNK